MPGVTRLAPLALVFALASAITGAVPAPQNGQDTPPQPGLTFKSGVDLVSVSVVVIVTTPGLACGAAGSTAGLDAEAAAISA